MVSTETNIKLQKTALQLRFDLLEMIGVGKAGHLGESLQGHPDMEKTPGIEAVTGSLGQGLSIATAATWPRSSKPSKPLRGRRTGSRSSWPTRSKEKVSPSPRTTRPSTMQP